LVQHSFVGSIVEVPASGPKSEPVALPGPLRAVSDMSSDGENLYVTEPFPAESARVDVYSASSGQFQLQFPREESLAAVGALGLAVGRVGGEVRLFAGADRSEGECLGVIAVFDTTGHLIATWDGADTPQGSFGCAGAVGVASDTSEGLTWASGDVYVADVPEGKVDVFKPLAGGGEEFVTQFEAAEGVPFQFSQGERAIGVDAQSGNVLVQDGAGTVDVFKPGAVPGQFERSEALSGGRITSTPFGPLGHVGALATDDSNGDIYILDSEAGATYQFSSAGAYLGRLIGTPQGPFQPVRGLAVSGASKHLYVATEDSETGDGRVDVFGAGRVVPDLTTGSASALAPDSATLGGAVNPDNAGEATCQFNWGTTSALGNVAACEASVPDGGSLVPVQASLAGLAPDTIYHFRLQAANGNGVNPGEEIGEQLADPTFTTLGPGIHATFVTNLTADAATLNTGVDPNNTAGSSYFEYGTDTSYKLHAPVPPGRSIGAGKGDVTVREHVQGLLASTIYHYRVVTLSEIEPGHIVTFHGPDHTFQTQPASLEGALPDKRAWQLVSPTAKQGALFKGIPFEGGVIQAAAAGDAITYLAVSPTEGSAAGASNQAQILSIARDQQFGLWESRDIAIPHREATDVTFARGQEYRMFSADLSQAVVQPAGFDFDSLISADASEQTAYRRTSYQGESKSLCSSDCFRPLVTAQGAAANVAPGLGFGDYEEGDVKAACSLVCGPFAVGGTSDLSSVAFVATPGLTSREGDEGGLYRWTDGHLELISVLPGGQPASAVSNPRLGYNNHDVRGAISTDATRMAWSEVGGHLYLRDTRLGATLQLDSAQGGTGSGPSAARFQYGNGDDSRIYFTDQQQLTADAGAKQGAPDLYECRVTVEGSQLKCALTDLTPLHEGASANVQGMVMGAGSDLSYVYFVAEGAFAPGAVHGSCAHGESDDSCNLYVEHDGGPPKLVAVLSAHDAPDWSGPSGLEELPALTSRVSPSGHWLAFMSQRQLSPYDNRDASSGQRDEEVYLYNTDTGRLDCASCAPDGAAPEGVPFAQISGRLVGGNETWRQISPEPTMAALIPGWTGYTETNATYQSRYLSDSGRLFFDSNDSLAAQDNNHTWDVYEHEPVGVGDCRTSSSSFSATSEGCIGLLSSGTSSEESAFMDASESGDDVFFLTSEKLVERDGDTSGDLYDAHVCTEVSPCLSSPSQSQPCVTGDSCKPAPSPQPDTSGSPPSSVFSGAGNLRPRGTPPSPSRSQLLKKALKTCRQKHIKRKRSACEKHARARYGPKRHAKKTAGRKGRR
jgi:hypothetical protein